MALSCLRGFLQRLRPTTCRAAHTPLRKGALCPAVCVYVCVCCRLRVCVRVCAQYTTPFSSVDLTKMAEAFNTNVG